jgi:CRP-like cAMP-binding protein
VRRSFIWSGRVWSPGNELSHRLERTQNSVRNQPDFPRLPRRIALQLQDQTPVRGTDMQLQHLATARTFPSPLQAVPSDPLEPLGVVRSFRRDQEIYAEGEPANYGYRVITGAVRLVKLLEDGRRQIIEFLLPGDHIGFDLLPEHEFSAETVTDTTLKSYSRRRVEQLAEQNPGVARRLRDQTARDLRRAQTRIVSLGRKSAAERIAGFLVEMAERTRGMGNALNLPMARTDIADHLGLTVETVCRTLSRLKQTNTIAIAGGKISISNRHQLELVSRELH